MCASVFRDHSQLVLERLERNAGTRKSVDLQVKRESRGEKFTYYLKCPLYTDEDEDDDDEDEDDDDDDDGDDDDDDGDDDGNGDGDDLHRHSHANYSRSSCTVGCLLPLYARINRQDCLWHQPR